MFVVAQGCNVVTVASHVLADLFRWLTGIHVHQLESYAMRSKLLNQSSNLRRVAIGDWAVRAHEQENGGLGSGPSEWVNQLSGEIRQAHRTPPSGPTCRPTRCER